MAPNLLRFTPCRRIECPAVPTANQIVFLDRATFAPVIRFDATRIGGAAWREYPVSSPEQVVERARDAAVLITNKIPAGAGIIEQLPRLRLIAVAATGVDHIDLDGAKARGIGICNVPGYATQTVPEHVFGMLLMLRRNLHRYAAAVGQGAWSQSNVFCLHDYPIRDLAGATMGIVGAGTLGRAVGRIAEAFGMRVLFAERKGASNVRAGYAVFDGVLACADVLSLHVPLTPATRGLIGREDLARMKPDAVLVNCARGGVVDEAALLEALRLGKLGGACVDVLETEPPRAGSALASAALPNLIVTPHIAWASIEAQQRLADELIENIAAFLRGERRNRVV
jgi:glycerate dehydrogenase